MLANSQLPFRALFALVVTVFFAGNSHADVNWDGDNAAGNFSYANNWYGDTVPSFNFSSGNLVFNYRNNPSQLNQFYDFAGWANINDIIWETTWAVPTTFNGNGNGLNFNQRLENRSAQSVTIGSMNLSGGKNGATQIELNPVNGDLTLNGNLYNDNNLRYKVYGANSKMLTVNTALGGNSSVALDIEQYSKVKFTAAQTMGSAAAYNVRQGELWLDTGGSLANGSTVNLGQADANVAKFYLAPSSGGLTHGGNITVANSGGIKVLGSLASSGTNTFSGNITLNGTAQLENVSSGGTVNLSGTLSGGSGINIGATNATGRVLLSGSNSYTGATLVQQGGTLVVTHQNALGATNGGTTVQSGATLEYNNVNAAPGEVVTISGTGTSGQGALYANRSSGIAYLDSKVVLAGSARIGGTSSTYLSTVDTAGSELNLHLNGSAGIGGFSLTASSKITGSGSVNLTRTALAGSSVDFGNAVNDYTGGTTVGTGIDLSGSGASLVGNITNNGSVSFYTGTNAFTGNISGTGSVNKSQSTGLLQLASSNSYTGSTLISAGTLLVTHNNALGSTNGATTVSSGSTLAFSNNVSVAENVTVAGSGVTNSGALRNIAGNNTLSGQLTLSTNGTVRSDAGLLTLSGQVSGSAGGTRALTLDGSGNTKVDGAVLSSVSSIDKIGSGTATLNGAVSSASVNVSAGTLALGAADRIANSSAVTVSGTGSFNLNGDDTVASLSTTGGTVGGTGTLTAANYNLNGGTVNANLGSGTVTASSGTTSLNGTAGATAITVNGGTLNTGAGNKLADVATVAVTAGALGVGGNDTVGSLAVSSSGTVNVATGSTLTATANSTISGSGKAVGGTLAVTNNANLNLANNATTTTSDLSIGAGSALTGTGGTTGKIGGGGLLSAGNSPGILTAGQLDLTGEMDFAFEFTGSGAPIYSQAGNSRNDLLHLTSGATPFVGSFTAANSISLFFNDSSLNSNLLSTSPTTYLGGFYVDSLNFDIAALLSAASKTYYVADANGLISFNGVNYTPLSADISSHTVFGNTNQSNSAFDTGTTSGTVLSVTMVPEPSTASLLTLSIIGAMTLRRRRA